MARPHRTTWISIAAALLAFALTPNADAARNPDLDHSEAPPDPVMGKVEVDAAGADPDADEVAAVDETNSPVSVEFRLSSRYGWRRSGRTGLRTFHAGVDFNAPRGTSVEAARSGTVVVVTRDSDRGNGMSGYGNAVVVYHKDEDRWTLYAHLDEVVVKPGVVVEAGQALGLVGRSTNRRFPRMGAHLHFEVRERTRDDEAPFPGPYRVNNIDPRAWLAGHGIVYDRRGHFDHDAREEYEALAVAPAAG